MNAKFYVNNLDTYIVESTGEEKIPGDGGPPCDPKHQGKKMIIYIHPQ